MEPLSCGVGYGEWIVIVRGGEVVGPNALQFAEKDR
jgi:hypothetical protein